MGIKDVLFKLTLFFRWIEYTTKNALGVATQITCAPQNRICEIGANAEIGHFV